MAIKVDFLSSGNPRAPWRKEVGADRLPTLAKPPYKLSSSRVTTPNLASFLPILKEKARTGSAMLRGLLKTTLNEESRANKTDRTASTTHLELDIDGTTLVSPDVLGAQSFLEVFLGLPTTQFIAIFTSSAGLPRDGASAPGLRCQIIIELQTPLPLPVLEAFLTYRGLVHPELADEAKLDPSGRVLLPIIDSASSRPSQVFTIAPPKFINPSDDPFSPPGAKAIPRIVLHSPPGARKTLPVRYIALSPAQEGDLIPLRAQIVSQKRAERGLPIIGNPGAAFATRVDPQTFEEYLFVEGPIQPASVTDIREQGPFVRLNLNGGDSWAYWHPEANFQYVKSFKGHIMYQTKDLLPEYYQSLVAQSLQSEDEEAAKTEASLAKGELLPLVCLNRTSEQFHCGLLTSESTWEDVETFSKASSIISWLETHKLPKPFDKQPPIWTTVFDPDKPFISPRDRVLNRFSRPPEPAGPALSAGLDPDFGTLLHHVLGDDEEMVETFLDWLAFIYQTRRAPQSAWLLHGTAGTGKDLTTRILFRVLGRRYCKAIMPHMLNEGFNGWAEDASLVLINEVDSSVFGGGRNTTSRLNDYITGDSVSIRKMRANVYEVPNRTGYIFASNCMAAVELPANDRRYHIPPRQETPLLQEVETSSVSLDLQRIYYPPDDLILSIRGFLRDRAYDEDRLRRPVMTTAKQVLEEASMPAASLLSSHLRTGQWGEVVYHLDSYPSVVSNMDHYIAGTVQEFCQYFARACETRASRCVLTLDETRSLYAIVCDRRMAQMGKGKFRQFLRHRELTEAAGLVSFKREGLSVRGVVVPLPPREHRAKVLEELATLGYLGTASSRGTAERGTSHLTLIDGNRVEENESKPSAETLP